MTYFRTVQGMTREDRVEFDAVLDGVPVRGGDGGGLGFDLAAVIAAGGEVG